MIDCRNLFVYGTLMANAGGHLGREQRRRLHASGCALGPATIPGRLVDLGSYPGLVEPVSGSDVVHGEVIAIDAPREIFVWLDPYEGIGLPDRDGEYSRVVRDVSLADGSLLNAWVYLMTRDVSGYPVIAGGRWATPR